MIQLDKPTPLRYASEAGLYRSASLLQEEQ
jgi:hypothetical protein